MAPRERGKPYNRGNPLKNFFAVLCWPKPITCILKSSVADRRYIQPRAYWSEEDHRFDKLPMVGEGAWDDANMDDTAPETDVPMPHIGRS